MLQDKEKTGTVRMKESVKQKLKIKAAELGKTMQDLLEEIIIKEIWK